MNFKELLEVYHTYFFGLPHLFCFYLSFLDLDCCTWKKLISRLLFSADPDNKYILCVMKQDPTINTKVDQHISLLREQAARIRINPYMIKDFVQTLELCQISVEENSNCVRHVDDDIATSEREKCLELWKNAVKKNPHLIEYISDAKFFRDPQTKVVDYSSLVKIYRIAVSQKGDLLETIPAEILPFEDYLEICALAVQKNGLLLQLIPKNYRTKEICVLAVKQNPQAEHYVP